MCGLLCIIKQQTNLGHAEDALNTILHRGPDGNSVEHVRQVDFSKDGSSPVSNERSIVFGHCRLAIIDPSERSNQPFHYRKRYSLIFNGQIYNYREIKRELHEIGFRFDTESDTEVVCAAFAAWGVECFSKFNGMWALLIYDSQEDRLVISRDRFGVKPLYYYYDDQQLVLASEIKAVALAARINLEPNFNYLRDFKRTGPLDYREETAFEGVFSFRKSSYVVFNMSSNNYKMNFVEYWSLSDASESALGAPQPAKEDISEILTDAVKMRLRSDVRISTALSGGLDSSIISCIVKSENSGPEITAFTNGYPDCEDLDETGYARIAADHIQIKLETTTPDVNTMIEDHQNCVWHVETPMVNSLMSTWATYKLVNSNGVRVTLDGQGADELFAGYPRYLQHSVATEPLMRTLGLVFCGILSDQTRPYVRNGIALRLLSLLGNPGKDFLANRASAEFMRRAFGDLKNAMLLDFDTTLSTYFNNVDKIAMAHGVESRMPFMDYRVVEKALALRPHQLIKGGNTKVILRDAFQDRLPEAVTRRKDKKGWPVRDKAWFMGDHLDHFVNTINAGSGTVYECPNVSVETAGDFPFADLMRNFNLSVWYSKFIKK